MWLDRLAEAQERFADQVALADARALVASCPGWTTSDLIAHVVEVHQWVVHAIQQGSPDGTPGPVPTDVDAFPDWYLAEAAALRAVLDDAGPDGAAWTFGNGPHTAGWWARRQLHEVLMHTRDAGDLTPFDADLAWDGVDEVVTMFYPRQVRLGRVEPASTTLRLTPTDVDASPLLLGEPDQPIIDVTGTAEELLMLLWRRTKSDDAEVAVALDRAITP